MAPRAEERVRIQITLNESGEAVGWAVTYWDEGHDPLGMFSAYTEPSTPAEALEAAVRHMADAGHPVRLF